MAYTSILLEMPGILVMPDILGMPDLLEMSDILEIPDICLLYTSPSPRDGLLSRMPSSA